MYAPRRPRICIRMTIHSILRDIPQRDVMLPDAVRGATTLKGVLRLLRALGLETCDSDVCMAPIDCGQRNDIVAAGILAERGTLCVVHARLAGDPAPPVILECARILRRAEPVRPLLFVMSNPAYKTITLACYAGSGELRHLTFEPATPLASDLDVLQDMIAAPGEPGVALALRYANALDRKIVNARFFAQVKTHRDMIATAWVNLPLGLIVEREQLALLLLCRLMFLYFLQRQGHLAGDYAYMIRRVRDWQHAPQNDNSLYRTLLVPLFFGALNTRPDRRTADALALGPLPYLNGGLFERTPVERRFETLDIADSVMLEVFESLLERFRFTASDASAMPSGLAGTQIDPEMLGRVFEGLMSADRRGQTGTFYTPPHVVDLLTQRTLAVHLENNCTIPGDSACRFLDTGDAAGFTYTQRSTVTKCLREVRVLDPACGSGAFLLGALSRISSSRVALGEDHVAARRNIVGQCLHGVDLLADAALLCSLRLWLALANIDARIPPPLPNLDRRIRQGDALLDPLELLTARTGSTADARASRDKNVRSALSTLAPLNTQYLDAEPEQRLQLRKEITRAESDLARAWVTALDQRLLDDLRDARAVAASFDLWGLRTGDAQAADRVVSALELRRNDTASLIDRIEDSAGLPFFSFRVHFAEHPNFNIILSNPPWVRAHRWPALVRAAVRDRYEVCRCPASPGSPSTALKAAGQVDLAVLFLERALSLLAPRGTLGMLLPAKMMRSLYAGGARALLHRVADISSIDDHSLDQRSIFRADAFTISLVASRKPDHPDTARPRPVHVHMRRRGVECLEFDLPSTELSLLPGDPAAPWLIAPPDAIRAFRKMQQCGGSIAGDSRLSVKRGVVTGANDILVVREFAHKLGGLTHIRAEGFFRARRLSQSTVASRRFVALVETLSLRPLLRGADVHAWRASPSGRVVWTGADKSMPRTGRVVLPGHPRLDKYLARHEAALRARTGVGTGGAIGAVMRVSVATLGHKVVWRDIAETLHAAIVPDRVKGDDGGSVPVIPLNTVYFVSVPDHDTALLLAAYLNSLPLRVLARAAAERAKDAHFRFFAWTVGMLPLPADWTSNSAHELRGIAIAAHEVGGIAPVQQARLDALVARAYGLDDQDVAALLQFDAWLSGRC